MSFSVLTNRAAMQALAAVSDAGKRMSGLQQRVSTGLKVASVKDDSAAFIISRTIQQDVAGWRAVGSSLARAASIVDVATMGTEQISDLLNELKGKALTWDEEALDERTRTALRHDIMALVDQIDSVAAASEYDGVNLLRGVVSIPTAYGRVASTSYSSDVSELTPFSFGTRMGALPTGVSLSTSTPSGRTLPRSALTPSSFHGALGETSGTSSKISKIDAGASPGRVNLLVNAMEFPDVFEIWQNGVRVAASGQPPASNGAPVGAGQLISGEALLSFEYDPSRGQELELRVNAANPRPRSAWNINAFTKTSLSDPIPSLVPFGRTYTYMRATAPDDSTYPIEDPEEYGLALGSAPSGVSADYTIDPGLKAGRVDFTFDAFTRSDTLEVWQGGTRVAATGQPSASGGSAVAAGTPVSGANTISFDYDPSRGPVTFRVNENSADADSAWVIGALTLQPAGSLRPASQAKSSSSGRQVTASKTITLTIPTSPKGEMMEISPRNLSSSALGLGNLDRIIEDSFVRMVESAQERVLEAASHFGAMARNLSRRANHSSALTDALVGGIGKLVDADMTKEHARLQAEQVRQQLALQSLAISVASPKAILSLFPD